MACPLKIPDDFPGKSLLEAIRQIGGFLGSNLLTDTIPRTLVVTKGGCRPTTTGVLGTAVMDGLNVASLFYLMVLLFPSAIDAVTGRGTLSRWVWGFVILFGGMILLPTLTALITYGMNQAGSYDNPDDTQLSARVTFGITITICILLFVVGSIVGAISSGSGVTLITLPLFTMITLPIAKSLLPVLILLLGPGVIPLLSGKSFLEYCVS